MSNNKELQRQASDLYNLATEARTVKNTVEFIALLLLLKKEDLLLFPTLEHHFGDTYNEDIEDEIRAAIQHLDVYDLRDYLLSISNRVLEYTREDFISILNFLEYNIPNSKDYYGKLLDEVIFYAAKSGDKRIVEGAQPREITKLVEGLIENYFIENIYNPFAGIGSYYTSFTNSISYCYSQEINNETWVLGYLRCLLYDISPDSYRREDSIKNWSDRFYDLTIAFPPLNYRIPTSYFEDHTSHYADDFLVKNIVQIHAHDSIFIGLFASSYLSRQFTETKWLRSYLIDHDILECVIALPPNILYTTSASTVLIVINTNKEKRGQVKFVDGSEFYNSEGKLNIIDVEDLLTSIKKDEEECIKFVSNEEIREQDYVLDIKRYFYREDSNSENYKVRSLWNILKPIKGEKISLGLQKHAKIVRFSSLKDDIIDYTITSENLTTGKVHKDYQKISRDTILLSVRYGELKPTYIKVNDEDDVYHITGIRTFELKKTSDISIDYLMYYLNSNTIKEYVKAYSVGTTIQFLSFKDLGNIKIPIPPLQQQEKILNAVRKTYKEGISKEIELEKAIKEKEQKHIEELQIKKHSLSQSFSNFDASINTLFNFMRKDGCISLDDIISERQQITVRQHLEKMVNSSRQVGDLIEKLTNNLEFEPAREINIDRFLSDYIKNYPSNERFEFNYIKDEDSLLIETDIEGMMSEITPLVSISSKELSGALEDIISNAKIHGFIENDKKYFIRINLSYKPETNMVIINIENNGTPLPKGLDTKRYKTKNEIAGKTGRSGIGGFHSSQVVEHYNGKLSLVRNDSSDFPVLISIELPLIKK